MLRVHVLVALALLLAAAAAVARADSTLRFAGTSFKIVQFADMHYSNGALSPCQDIAPEERPCSDVNTTVFMGRVLDAERPSLVVFTGDNLVGSAVDMARSVTEYSQPCVDRQIPWAIVFGNHDDEGGQRMTREKQMEVVMGLPYAVSEFGPSDIEGVGNYVISLLTEDGNTNLANLYFVDSGAYSQVAGVSGYDWIRPSQVNWYAGRAAALKAQNGGAVRPALAFFHIPIMEYELMTDFVGDKYEGVYDPNLNSGFFVAMKEAGDVRATFVGHDHVNAGCGTYVNVKLCYAGGVGFGAYGRVGWPRRARVIQFENNAQRATSWLRLSDAVLSKAFEQELYAQ